MKHDIKDIDLRVDIYSGNYYLYQLRIFSVFLFQCWQHDWLCDAYGYIIYLIWHPMKDLDPATYGFGFKCHVIRYGGDNNSACTCGVQSTIPGHQGRVIPPQRTGSLYRKESNYTLTVFYGS